jgi:chemotaxis protein MotB
MMNESISNLLEEEPSGGWLVTYADLMTLLLTFFILLFSISSMNLEKFKNALAAIQVSLGEESPPVQLLEIVDETKKSVALSGSQADSVATPAPEQKIALENLIGLKSKDIYRDVQRFIRKREVSDHIVVTIDGSKIVIRVTGQVLFESGIAILNPEATPILNDITDIIKRSRGTLTIFPSQHHSFLRIGNYLPCDRQRCCAILSKRGWTPID